MDIVPKFMRARHWKHNKSGKEAVRMDIGWHWWQRNTYCEIAARKKNRRLCQHKRIDLQ